LSHVFVEQYIVPLQLALAMFGMGAALVPRDFLNVGKQPFGLGLGLFIQLVIVPALAVLFITVFSMSPGWAVGLCLIAAVPGGAFSNLLTYIGRGNVALSIAITVASTSLCVLTVPLLLRLLVSTSLPEDFVFPVQRVVIEIGAYLIGPLVIGMLVRRFWRARSDFLSKVGINGAVVLIILITISALRSGRIKVLEYGFMPPLIIILFGTTLALITPHISRFLGRTPRDAVAITIEVTVRNMGVGLLVVPVFFPDSIELRGQVLYSCLFYAGASGLFALPPAITHRMEPDRYPTPMRAAARLFGNWRNRRASSRED